MHFVPKLTDIDAIAWPEIQDKLHHSLSDAFVDA